MTLTLAEVDPKGLIRESYKIDGITAAQCRSIFLDWAISVPMGADTAQYIHICLDSFAKDAPDHPMTQTLEAGLAAPTATGRRGGRARRVTP